MGQDAFMEHSSGTFCLLRCNIYFLLLGTCSMLTLRIPSTTIHGIEGQLLVLPVHYNFNSSASGIQIIWLFEKYQTPAIYLLSSVNQSVVPDLEFQHKFTLNPPNASLVINSLHMKDEGNYNVKVNIHGSPTVSANQNIHVTVNVPVSKPIVLNEPLHGAVENVGNVTFKCSVSKGNRVIYQWLKNGKPLPSSPRYSFSPNNDTLFIDPAMKKDIGNYSCLARNLVSEMESEPITPTIYYGPYELTVNSDKGLKVGEVFTVDIGESVQFDCSADSNPPNTFAWIQRTENSTEIINYGPYFKVLSEKVGQKTLDYMCRAYNNITGKLDETQFTVILTSIDPQKLTQKGNSLSSLAAITGISLFIILAMSLLFVGRKYHLHRAIKWKLQNRRPSTEYRRTQIFSGHEDALNDFGIYEFVSFPDPSATHRASSNKSVSTSNVSQAHDVNCTVYEVIRHVPEQPQNGQQELNQCSNTDG
ncbi:HEPACAM family member 2 [Bombina bombina]|uniref:HEPACAM family member 2 n=1 Tax=Bombina bombina TaxID=8345 RepID=UPI00235ACA23|nr:HEPACAM family member 2 [Bombina bombina]